MKYALSSQSYASNRRSKEGDWICLKCANYNYSFRQVCRFIGIQATGASSRSVSLTSTG
jgi:hypothetical protein